MPPNTDFVTAPPSHTEGDYFPRLIIYADVHLSVLQPNDDSTVKLLLGTLLYGYR